MILIWGFRARKKKIGEGVFYSPAAGRDAPYHVVEMRRWFTLFFIPLLPLKTLGTYIECQATGSTYDPAILNRPTNDAILQQLTATARELVAAVAVADGPPSAPVRAAAIDTVKMYEPAYDGSNFDADAAAAPSSHLDDRLLFLGENLTSTGQERLIGGAATVAAARGSIGPGADALLRSAGQRLSMSPAHVSGIVDSVANPPSIDSPPPSQSPLPPPPSEW